MSNSRNYYTHKTFCERVDEIFQHRIAVDGQFSRTANRVDVSCNVCGYRWNPLASSLLSGHGCKRCADTQIGLARRLSPQIFEERIGLMFDGKLTILSEYTRRHDKVAVRCNVCQHQWSATPHNLLHGEGCPECAHKICDTHHVRDYLTTHNYQCELLGEYVDSNAKCVFKCACGNIFKSTFSNLKKIAGRCKACTSKSQRDLQLHTQDEAVSMIRTIDNGDYELLSQYIGYTKHITLRHSKCGHVFKVRFDHFVGEATKCPVCFCNISFGEKRIASWLESNNIDYVYQKQFDGCVGDFRHLKFDFYIESHNLAIEYQGEQHYHPLKIFGGATHFEQQTKYDELKRQYCQTYGITLLEIPYWRFKEIDKILDCICGACRGGGVNEL